MPSVTRKSRTRREERRAETQRRLAVALETLMEQGESFTEVSVERLVSEAGISRSTFYVYFEDKSVLLRAITQEMTQDFLEVCKAWWDLPPGHSREELKQAFSDMFEAYRPQRALMAAVAETAAYDSEVRAEYTTMVDVFIKGVTGHIRRAQKSNQIDASFDAPNVAAWITWMIERGLYQFVGGASKAKTEKYLSAMTDIVWNALYAGAQRRP